MRFICRLWFGFYQVSLGVITIGELTAFHAYVFNIGFGLGQVGGNAAKVYEALGATDRIFYLTGPWSTCKGGTCRIWKRNTGICKGDKSVSSLKLVGITGSRCILDPDHTDYHFLGKGTPCFKVYCICFLYC